MPLPVLLDASVLRPALLCDVLLRLAEAGAYRPHWSTDATVELHRALASTPGIGPRAAARRVREMNQAFTDAAITGYEGLSEAMTCAPQDRPVLAAAVHGGCQVILTFDPQRFAPQSTVRYFVQPVHPDDFLLDHLDLDAGTMMNALDSQLSAMRWSNLTVVRFLDRLQEAGLPGFASELRRRAGSASV